MRENLERSLDIALRTQKWIAIENNVLTQLLTKYPDLSDELQELLAQMANDIVVKYEAVCDTIAVIADRKSIFGEVGIEKQCGVQIQDEDECEEEDYRDN